MNYFNLIYYAAKSKDAETLKDLFKMGACIDEREKNESFNSPAGKLAREGDIESAYFLIDKAGANVELVINGLLSAGNDTEASKLMTQFNFTKNRESVESINSFNQKIFEYLYKEEPDQNKSHREQQIQAAVAAGHIQYAHELEKRYHLNLSNEDMINYAAHGGHLYFIENMFAKSHNLTEQFAYWMGLQHAWFPVGYQSSRFSNPELALHTLSFISDENFLKAVTDKFIWICSSMDYNIEPLIEKSRKIHYLMQNENLGYQDALKTCENKIVDLPPMKRGFFHHDVHVVTDENGKNVGVKEVYGLGGCKK